MKKPENNKVEVDMVPLIDIISLLLMFLIIVGYTAAQAGSIQMKLPRADMAKPEKDIKAMTQDRIIVQVTQKDGKWIAVVNNRSYELLAGGNSKTLIGYLQEQVTAAIARGDATKAPDGAVSIPVKLRIPEEAPMSQVERVVMSLSQAGLVNIQYTADNTAPKS